MSNTVRSKRHLERRGYLVAVTERWNSFARIRQDMFGFIDLLAVRDGEVLAVQTTSASNVSSRVKKIADHDNVAIIRKAGIRIEVHGWEKRGNRWEVRVVDIS